MDDHAGAIKVLDAKGTLTSETDCHLTVWCTPRAVLLNESAALCATDRELHLDEDSAPLARRHWLLGLDRVIWQRDVRGDLAPRFGPLNQLRPEQVAIWS